MRQELGLELGQQRLVLLLGQKLKLEPLLGLLLQPLLGVMLLQQLMLLMVRVLRRLQRQWQGLGMEKKPGTASLTCPVQRLLSCTLKQMST